MSQITTHILDTSRGRPASGVTVTLEIQFDGSWKKIGGGVTDSDGRIKTLLPEGFALERAAYRLTFETGAYFGKEKVKCFYPSTVIVFSVDDLAAHYHVPLLLSPWGYSTYRGS